MHWFSGVSHSSLKLCIRASRMAGLKENVSGSLKRGMRGEERDEDVLRC